MHHGPSFSVSVEPLDERTNLVEATGDIDVVSADEFEERLLESIDSPRVDAVVIDLTAVTFVGSAALNALVRSLERPARYDSLRVAIVADDSRVTTILEVSGLDRLFPIRSTREAAIGAVRAPPP
jgi:anti-sigma B factor antagonist